MASCEVKGCRMPATHKIDAWSWAEGDGPSAAITVRMRLCRGHAEGSPLHDSIATMGWAQLREVFHALGIGRPDFTKLSFSSSWGLYHTPFVKADGRQAGSLRTTSRRLTAARHLR